MNSDSNSVMRTAIEPILRAAGELAREQFGRAKPATKEDGSWVTEADRRVETYLTEALTTEFPGTGVLGEEGHRVEGTGTWYIDPIDGTTAYVQGLAYWGPTVCLVRDGVLEVGALYLPMLDEFWYAERDGGAWLNGERIRRRDDDAVRSQSGLFVPSDIHRRPAPPWPGKIRALGSTAAHLALVAAGRGAAVVIPRWSLWDIGCGVLLIEEAGGRICDVRGESVQVTSCLAGLPILAGASTALHLLTVDGWAVRALE
jgi:myo-inositol-1(or 4)-monophosphatase